MPFHSVHCGFERPVFSLRGQARELDAINQTIDSVGFPFKVQGGSTGVSGGAVELYKPLAEQTFDSVRLCAAEKKTVLILW